MTFKHLDDDTITAITNALIDLGLTSDEGVNAMTTNMSPKFAAVVRSGSGVPRLLMLADRMNTTRVLVSGEVPLNTWLKNCIKLAADQPEGEVFRQALERASTDGRLPADPEVESPPTPTAALDVSSVPKLSGGGLEIAIGGMDDTLEVQYLLRGSAASLSVAKLLVHRFFDGSASFLAGNKPDEFAGTGWLIAPGLMITNHHVVNARQPLEPPANPSDFQKQGAAVTVQFDYLKEGAAVTTARSVACVASDVGLDFAVLRIEGSAPARAPLALRNNPILRPKERELRERVNVLQHPDGKPMRLGFRNNFVVTGTDVRLSYLTDTAGGSSGSPICDDEWFVAGLHRGFTMIDGPGVQVWGQTIHQENYGTPIGQILSWLATNEPDIRAEIETGQLALAAEG